MDGMRRIILGFMTFLMLTPVLTCVMAFCPLQSAQAADVKPCHQQRDAATPDQQTPDMQNNMKQSGPMFALDCMGVDLFQPDMHTDFVTQPDQSSVDYIDMTWVDLTSGYDFRLAARYSSRGPPFDLAGPPHLQQHDLYLTTQRLRL